MAPFLKKKRGEDDTNHIVAEIELGSRFWASKSAFPVDTWLSRTPEGGSAVTLFKTRIKEGGARYKGTP